jgi:hypothetical protein
MEFKSKGWEINKSFSLALYDSDTEDDSMVRVNLFNFPEIQKKRVI